MWLENGIDVGTLVAKIPTVLLGTGRYTVQTSVFSSSNGEKLVSHGAHIHILTMTTREQFFPHTEDSIDVQLPAMFDGCQRHLPSAHPRRISAFAGHNTAIGSCAVAVSALTDSVATGPAHEPKPTSYSYSYA